MRTRTTLLALASAGTLALFLTGCEGDAGGISGGPAPAPAPAPAPGPAPTPTPTSFNVTRCLNQQVALGTSVTNLVIPDTLTVNPAQPSGFPNGRKLDDPVVDITLAVIFLDLTRHPATTFANVPLNPRGDGVTLPAGFPYFAPPQGSPPLPPGGGVNFNFRTDPASAYTRVDRMGQPAVATALISSPAKVPYNDDNPAQDVTGKYVQEITSTLTGLTNALADDLTRLGLTPCATPA